jgi:hypothetical protein
MKTHAEFPLQSIDHQVNVILYFTHIDPMVNIQREDYPVKRVMQSPLDPGE